MPSFWRAVPATPERPQRTNCGSGGLAGIVALDDEGRNASATDGGRRSGQLHRPRPLPSTPPKPAFRPRLDDVSIVSRRGLSPQLPADETNFVTRVWTPTLRAAGVPALPHYAARHTYISWLLANGARPLFVCRQTGTSLDMIEKHYGDARVTPDQLDSLGGPKSISGNIQSRNPAGTFLENAATIESP